MSDLNSIAEVMGQWGDYKPRLPDPNFKIDYAADAAEHWATQKPKIWDILAAKGVPPKLVTDLRGNVTEGTPALMAVEAFLKQPEKLLLMLIGAAQVGKSFACAYGLSTLTVTRRTQYGAEEFRTWRYWDGDFLWIRANQLGTTSARDYDQETRNAAKRLERVKLLVIDEVGGQTWGDISKRLEDLIGQRWNGGLKTMMTSNLGAAELREQLSDRIVARIRNVGAVVECKGLGESASPHFEKGSGE